MAWGDESANGSTVDVQKVLDSKAVDLLWEIAQLGALVSLSLTSDSGALMVSVTVDGTTGKTYVRHSEELIEWLEDSRPAISSACEAARASRASRRRGRGLRTL